LLIKPFIDRKAALRALSRGARRRAARARPDAARHAARNFLDAIPLADDSLVALYYPINDELDTEPLAAALVEKGVAIALPATQGKNRPLLFRRYTPGDPLIAGRFGEMVPEENAEAVAPSVVVAPLLAFTGAGGRLGYGGGYYDRTLAALRRSGDVLAVGYAYGAQEVDALPPDPLDEPLDWVVTERAAHRC